MTKKILALAQAAALLVASAMPALPAQGREIHAPIETGPRTVPLPGIGLISAGGLPAALAPTMIVTPAVDAVSRADVAPGTQPETGGEAKVSVVSTLLEDGPNAGAAAGQKDLGEASTGSQANFNEAAGLSRVREGEGPGTPAPFETATQGPLTLEKPLPLAGEYDYVVVGSGAGGAVVAAELAKKGFKVGVLEAGSGAEDPTNVVPTFHPFASEAPGSAKFFATQDAELDKRNMNYVAPGADGRGGIDKPRGWVLGGSPQVNAMITMLPHPSEWQKIYELTGDPDWKPDNMRRIWETSVEHNDSHALLKALDTLGRALRLKGLQNLGGHGFHGWLHVTQPSLTQASNILKDKQLSRIFFQTLKASAGRGGVANLLRRAVGGFDQNDRGLVGREGLSITPMAVRSGVRSDPRDYLEEVRRKTETGEYKGKIDILTGALATKVEFDDGDPPRAVGVRFLAGEHLYQTDNAHNAPALGTPTRIVAKNEVILAAGAFNTPQLLMLSGVGPKEELDKAGIAVKADRPGVGTNLQDRIEAVVVSRMSAPFAALEKVKFMLDPRKDPEFKKWLQTNSGFYSTNGALPGVAFKSDPALEKPDVYIFPFPSDFHGFYPGFSRDLTLHKDRFAWVILHAHQNNRAGRVTLNSSDPTKQPSVDLHSFDDPGAQRDVEAVAKAMEWIRLVNRKIGAQEELLPGPAVRTRAQLVQWIKENFFTHHPSGSSPLGKASDPNAVVDGDFRVIGTKGLRVVDASAVSTIPGLFPVAHFYTMATLAAEKISAAAEKDGKVPTGRAGEAKPSWSKDRSPSVSQDMALIGQLYDAFWGNNNGIADEKEGPGRFWRVHDFLARIPLIRDLAWVKDWDSPRTREFMKALSSPVQIAPAALAAIAPSYRAFYKMMKAIQARATGYPADRISEGVVKADGIIVTDPVTGKKTAVSHEIFYQRWDPPAGAAKKDIVVISPAYQATGRQWTRIAAALAQRGNTVLVMDNEYSGLSKGAVGKFTGDSLAAGIALMLTRAEELRSREALPGTLRVLGESLSAGAAYSGVLEAYNGAIDLRGRPLPKGPVYVGLINPYLGKIVPALVQTIGGVATKLRLPVPPIPTIDRFTNVYKDADARKRFNALARLEDVRVHPSGLVSSGNHLQHALRGVQDGRLKIPPNVSFGLLRTTNDQSIDRAQTDWLERQAGRSLSYVKRIPDLPDHALVLNYRLQDDIVALASAGQDGAPHVDPAPSNQNDRSGAGIGFKEKLRGGFSLGATDPAAGAAAGRDTPLTLRLGVEASDFTGFLADPDHALKIAGALTYGPFGAQPVPVSGKLALLPNGSGKIVMAYTLALEIGGKPYTVVGKKFQQPGFHPYRDTTVLFTELHEGGPGGALAGAGVIKLGPIDVANLAGSLKGLGGKGPLAKAAAVVRFGRFFVGGLFARYALGQN